MFSPSLVSSNVRSEAAELRWAERRCRRWLQAASSQHIRTYSSMANWASQLTAAVIFFFDSNSSLFAARVSLGNADRMNRPSVSRAGSHRPALVRWLAQRRCGFDMQRGWCVHWGRISLYQLHCWLFALQTYSKKTHTHTHTHDPLTPENHWTNRIVVSFVLWIKVHSS